MFVADFPRSTHQYNIAYDFPMILARKGCGVFPTSIDSAAQMHQMRRPGAFPEWRVEREVWDRAARCFRQDLGASSSVTIRPK